MRRVGFIRLTTFPEPAGKIPLIVGPQQLVDVQ